MPEYQITAESIAEIESLHEHLVQEGLAGVRPTLSPAVPEPGTQGATEILTVLFTSGSGIILAQAIMAWVRTRQRKVTLRFRGGDGTETSFEATGPDAGESLKALLSAEPTDTRP